MTLTIIFLTVWFLAYLIWTYRLFGSLSSISESYYQFTKRKRSYGAFFTLFCWGLTAGLVTIAMLTDNALFFFSGAGFAFTGAAATFRDLRMTEIVHYIGAFIGIVTSLVGLWVGYNLMVPFIGMIAVTLLIALSNMKSKIYWIEVAAFIIFMVGLIYTKIF